MGYVAEVYEICAFPGTFLKIWNGEHKKSEDLEVKLTRPLTPKSPHGIC